MNAVECALEKQRLQFAIAAQRQALAGHVAGLTPLFAAADRVVAGAGWLKRHPEAVTAGVAVLVVARPRRWRSLWRWARRGLFVWRLWRDGERWLTPPAHAR